MENVILDSIKLALNSVIEGLITKKGAIETIENAMSLTCCKCSDENMVLNKQQEYPLDSISCGDAAILYFEKGLIFNCESGHVTGVFLPFTGLANNIMEESIWHA